MPPDFLGIRLQTPTLIGCYLLKNILIRIASALLFSSLTRYQQRSEIMTNFFKPCQALSSFFFASRFRHPPLFETSTAFSEDSDCSTEKKKGASRS
ncbi:hypothetical protein M8A51_25950, partial [Schlegelella sp. S2-27]